MRASRGFYGMLALVAVTITSVMFISGPSGGAGDGYNSLAQLPPHPAPPRRKMSKPRPRFGIGRRFENTYNRIDTPGKHVTEILQKVNSAVGRDLQILRQDPQLEGKIPAAKQIVIVTTWRSGSTFMEAFFDSHPAMFDIYEPLSQFGLQRARNGAQAAQAQALITDLLQCKYESIKYLDKIKVIDSMMDPTVHSFCNKSMWREDTCLHPEFLSKACQFFPWKILKIVRMDLGLLKPFLESPVSSDLRIIYLVRDPRAVIHSRRATVTWCKPTSVECYFPSVLCQDMDNDLESFKTLKKLYPDRIHLLRYEDFMNDVSNMARNVTQWVGLTYTTSMEKFIEIHTSKEQNKPWTTSRKSKEHLLHWTRNMSSTDLVEVQDACADTMTNFGYKLVNGTKNLSLKDVLNEIIIDL
ncbi:carbohydrate sulfotransferase 4 [Hyalella azteca]|uniref:Carbohydrate sulfotransferase 4 n=1 Tax=Hyalella azteca TaxID=294128 RepID=A0A979FVB4_HYAAZ|nr:carbohydrate sulfotransferase 4 [Hyalella azteca]